MNALRRIALVCVTLILGCPEASFDLDAEVLDGQVLDGALLDGQASDGGSDVDPPDGEPGVDSGVTDTAPSDTAPFDTAPFDAGPTSPLAGLRINEIEPEGEWIELYNGSSRPVSLDGYRICDSNDDGTPRIERAAAFPTGFELRPGEYLIAVEADEPEVGVLSMACSVGARCLHTGFGLSAGNGDTVFLVDADDSLALEARLPADAVEVGQSYCIFPNATGEFTACAPTPEATNALP